jgi:hypothetical protein
MKKIILLLLFISPFIKGKQAELNAQSATILPKSIQLPNVDSLGTCTTLKKGQLVLLTTNNQTYYCNGTTWVALLTAASDSPWLANGTHINNGNTGNVGIGIASPAQKLDVVGNIKVSGELRRPTTGNSNLLPIAYGTIQDNGNTLTTSGNWTLAHTNNSGIWNITVDDETIALTGYSLIASSNANFPSFVLALPVSGKLQIKTYISSGTLQDIGFSFVIYKP